MRVERRQRRLLIGDRGRPFEPVGPERRVVAERRHRLAPLGVAGKALEGGVDDAPGGEGDTGRPVGVRSDLDKHRVLIGGEIARPAAVFDDFADRLVAHRLDRRVDDDDEVAVAGDLLAAALDGSALAAGERSGVIGHAGLHRPVEEVLRERGVDDQTAETMADDHQPGVARILVAGPRGVVDGVAQRLGARQHLAHRPLGHAVRGRHPGPEGQILGELAGVDRQPAPADIDPDHFARRPAGGTLQFHLRHPLQQKAKRRDIGVAGRVVVLPAMDEDDDREILVARLLFEPVEQRIDLPADIGSALIVDFDKAEQEGTPGIIGEGVFLQRMRGAAIAVVARSRDAGGRQFAERSVRLARRGGECQHGRKTKLCRKPHAVPPLRIAAATMPEPQR